MTLSLPEFSRAHLLVIGDIMLDRYWTGTTQRISPEAPVPVVKVGGIEDRLGGAANVALNLAALGCQVSLCGLLGKDEAGARIKTLLKETQIIDATTSDEHTPTITKLRVLSRHQQLLRMDFEESLHGVAETALFETAMATMKNVDGVIISDYAKGTIEHPEAIIETCRQRNIPVFVDPKGVDYQRYRNASYLTPNLSELEAVVGSCKSLQGTFSKASKLQQELALDGLLVTLSEKGIALIQAESDPFHMPTSAKDVFDVTGAGDTVIATFAAAVASGMEARNATRLANLAAGVVVGKLGTSTASSEELKLALQQESKGLENGITSLERLLAQLAICRGKGEKIVFTNGCFDILHAGHVRYLDEAAALGDRLIVAINGDASIKRLKGEQRPIVDLNARMEVIAALRSVDWVLSFNGDTPNELIDALLPDILAKGGDYVAEDIVGYETVTKHGGEVTVLPFVDGCSTTSIVEKIKAL